MFSNVSSQDYSESALALVRSFPSPFQSHSQHTTKTSASEESRFPRSQHQSLRQSSFPSSSLRAPLSPPLKPSSESPSEEQAPEPTPQLLDQKGKLITSLRWRVVLPSEKGIAFSLFLEFPPFKSFKRDFLVQWIILSVFSISIQSWIRMLVLSRNYVWSS